MEEIRIKLARNGFTVSIGDEVYVAPTAFKLSELIRILIDKEYVPHAEKKAKWKARKTKV